MFINIIKSAINTFLKYSFEEIDKIKINILIKDKNFKGIINKLTIDAEQVIFNKIYVNKLRVIVNNISIKEFLSDRKSALNKLNLNINLELNKLNLNLILDNKKWSKIKNEIEFFISDKFGFNDVDIKNGYLYISSSNKKELKKRYLLKSEENNILLIDKERNKKLIIPMDPNLILKELIVCEEDIKISLFSNV